MDVWWSLILLAVADARMFCERTKPPLELGEWKYDLKHIDSAVVENLPVTINEGLHYVYDNSFPGYIIRYIHVDNVAIRSCGASAVIKSGGIGTSSVLIMLHADINQEIRSVVDIWGEKIEATRPTLSQYNERPKYANMLKRIRAMSHNR